MKYALIAVVMVPLVSHTSQAFADDNCGQVKAEVRAGFDVAKLAPCFHPTPADADL
jgi:hypothetical protein